MRTLYIACFIILLAGSLLLTVLAFGQPLPQSPLNNLALTKIPPPPNPASLGRYGEIPIGTYTGVPNISIPLFSESEGALNFDVSISYHSAGIKVEDEASSVGLGWALNGGGVITRVVKGSPDIAAGGLYSSGSIVPFYERESHSFSNVSDNSITCSPTDAGSVLNKYRMLDQGLDSQPDFFYYNFSGQQGTFYLDKPETGSSLPWSVKTVEMENIKVEYISPSPMSLVDSKWIVTSPDGTQYTFSEIEITRLGSSSPPSVGLSGSPSGFCTNFAASDQGAESNYWGQPHPYISSWYLTKIKAIDGNEINLTYTRTPYIAAFSRSQEYCGGLGWGYYKYYYDYGMINYSTVIREYDEVLLSEVTGKNFKIKFFTEARDDIKSYITNNCQGCIPRDNQFSKRYSDVRLYGKEGNSWLFSKGVKFTQSYFNQTAGADEKSLRLRLDKVQEYSGQTDKPPYSFTYNSTQLPPKSSLMRDFWGYYNANNTGSLIPQYDAPGCDILPYTCAGISYTVGDRSSNLTNCQAAILTQIQYPTGGTTSFEYELNSYMDSDLQPAVLKTGGGLRIKKVEDSKENGQIYSTIYSYSDGANTSGILLTPLRHTYMFNVASASCARFCDHDQLRSQADPDGRFVKVSSENLWSHYGAGGGDFVGYSKVTTQKQNQTTNIGGSTVSEFYNEVDQFIPLNGGGPIGGSGAFPGCIGERGSLVGKLKRETFLDGLGNVVSKKVYEYDSKIDDQIYLLMAYQSAIMVTQTDDATVQAYTGYDFVCQPFNRHWVVPKSIVETLYDGSIANSKTTTYEFANSVHKQKTADIISATGQPTYKITYSYPVDYTGVSTGSIQDLRNKFMHASPIEVVKWVKNPSDPDHPNDFLPYQGQYLQYQTVNGVPMPSKLYAYYKDHPALEALTTPDNSLNASYKQELELSYDATTLNLIQISPTKKPVESYQWGYNAVFPMAKGVGLEFSKFLYAGFEDNTTGNWTPYLGNSFIADGKTGKYALKGSLTTQFNTGSTPYELSFWMKGGHANVTDNTGSHSFDAGSDWTLVKLLVANSGTLYVSTSNDALIDDVILAPVGARINTYTYEPGKGLSSSTDINRTPSFFKYDGLGRLAEVKDQNSDILKSYVYRYFRQ